MYIWKNFTVEMKRPEWKVLIFEKGNLERNPPKTPEIDWLPYLAKIAGNHYNSILIGSVKEVRPEIPKITVLDQISLSNAESRGFFHTPFANANQV